LKNFKVLTLFLILALAISPTMFVDGKAFSIDLEKQQTIFENKQIIEQNDLTQKLKHSFITLHESISIQTNDENKNSELQSVQHDDIIISSLTNEHQYQQSYNNLELEIDQRISTPLIDFSISENLFDIPYESVDEINDQLIDTINSMSNVDNPMFMLLVLPLAGFILIRIENEKLNYNDLKRVFCFVFITILISSTVITPLSISSAYWGVAYAEDFSVDNQTSSDAIPTDPTNTESKEDEIKIVIKTKQKTRFKSL